LPYIQSTLMGGLGGVLYCLRATYLHCCFLKDWDESWLVWYYLRPLSSGITGLVSFFFLKAGLLVLDAKEAESISFGYYAIAFIAGYNVDNFLKKLENVAQSLFSIDKSTTSKDKRPSDG
ncbi:MAG TPA: hypothetical protein PLR48_06225, partial [Bacillota bacterium]|nr:hypothetical protein [Bacillota bacterium]